MSARTILKHLHQQGRMTDYQFDVINRNLRERPQGECNCSHCDYFKFSQSFIENIVKFMTDYNIETVEDLMRELNHINELLGGSNVFRS